MKSFLTDLLCLLQISLNVFIKCVRDHTQIKIIFNRAFAIIQYWSCLVQDTVRVMDQCVGVLFLLLFAVFPLSNSMLIFLIVWWKLWFWLTYVCVVLQNSNVNWLTHIIEYILLFSLDQKLTSRRRHTDLCVCYQVSTTKFTFI